MPSIGPRSEKIQRGKKLQRIEARIRPDQKSRIERAAGIRGTSISDFIVQNADEAARRTIIGTRRFMGNDRRRKRRIGEELLPAL